MSTPATVNEAIQSHYTRPDLGAAILEALAKAGKDVDHLTPQDLAPVDEFHIRGRTATLELARAAGLDASHRVLDVGSGLGGTARCLAKEFSCHATGTALTQEYCRTAEMLSARVGLQDLNDFRQGDALHLPFDEGMFDVAWSEHAAMNIEDKRRLYSEMYRVLRPGGILAIHDILAGPSGPVLFPVPWARTPQTSFLAQPDELRQLLEATGFTVSSWSDTTEAARAWFVSLAGKIQKEGLPAVGFHLLMGPDFQAMAQNQRRNLEEGRIVLAQVIARK